MNKSLTVQENPFMKRTIVSLSLGLCIPVALALGSAVGAIAPTTTTLSSSANPSFASEPVTMTATVTDKGNVSLFGVVAFSISNSSGTNVQFDCVGHTQIVGLSRTQPQTAVCVIPGGTMVPIGTHYVTAKFVSEDRGYAGSSAVLQQLDLRVSPGR
jgi:hypothetical protein